MIHKKNFQKLENIFFTDMKNLFLVSITIFFLACLKAKKSPFDVSNTNGGFPFIVLRQVFFWEIMEHKTSLPS